ncbi:MAG: hypothetical protein PHV95_07460, partial [Eubacteriales bacterium]|nr:hypothetical protein [Eubacteriales bacterium]
IDVADRSVTLYFKWGKDRLRNLVQDGNETYELEVNFYNEGQPLNDPYGRPVECFNPWLKTISPNQEGIIAPPDELIVYEDDWHLPGWLDPFGAIDQDYRGAYLYKTNLPLKARYADTLWPKVGDGNPLNFCIGISDAQYIIADYEYYYEIIGQSGGNQTGLFSITGQRGYKYNHETLPDRIEFFVFNEEAECLTHDGHDLLLTSLWGDSKYRLDRIIQSIDSRQTTDVLAKNNREVKWNSNGNIYYRNNSLDNWQLTAVDRNWDLWDTSWFGLNVFKGPIQENQ